MYVDNILYPVTALGPGRRIVIWTAGCSRHCDGCANPELWEPRPYQKISPLRLAEAVGGLLRDKKGQVEGFTISGGEPFDQAQELCEFLDLLPEKAGDEELRFSAGIQVFSGYLREELEEKEAWKALLERIDVLIDGPYIKGQNDGKAVLRGSVNQRIHFLDPAMEKVYEPYLKEGRKIENFVYDYRTLSVGIHNP